jgi:hypothetical protein
MLLVSFSTLTPTFRRYLTCGNFSLLTRISSFPSPPLTKSSDKSALCHTNRVSSVSSRSSERSNVAASGLGPGNRVPGGIGLNCESVQGSKILSTMKGSYDEDLGNRTFYPFPSIRHSDIILSIVVFAFSSSDHLAEAADNLQTDHSTITTSVSMLPPS